MPSFIKLHVVRARGLPIMDRSTGLTDAYVEIRFGKTERRTPVIRRSREPYWDYKARLEVEDDDELMNEPLVLQVMDKDVITADDSIGFVMLPLGPLLVKRDNGKDSQQLSGWFPIYDTIEGIRGEIEVAVRLQSFGDTWQGGTEAHTTVNFFTESKLAQNHYPQQWLLAFVVELIAENDPEFDWSDSFRSSRKSNQARQLLLYRMTHVLRSRIAKKVIDSGGNAIIGYQQQFDFEGDSGIVSRAYGTAAYVVHANDIDRPSISRENTPENVSPVEKCPINSSAISFCWHPYITKVLQAYRPSSDSPQDETGSKYSVQRSASYQADDATTPVSPNSAPSKTRLHRSISDDYSAASYVVAKKKSAQRYVEFARQIFGDSVVPVYHIQKKIKRRKQRSPSKHGSFSSGSITKMDQKKECSYSPSVDQSKTAAGPSAKDQDTGLHTEGTSVHEGSIQPRLTRRTNRQLLVVDPIGETEPPNFDSEYATSSNMPFQLLKEKRFALEELCEFKGDGCIDGFLSAPVNLGVAKLHLLSDNSDRFLQKDYLASSARFDGWTRNEYRDDTFRSATSQRHHFRKGVQRSDDVQIFSVDQLPLHARCNIGGMVAARSVKYLGRLHADIYDRDQRDQWWTELREEIKQHALRLRCAQIVGYRESVIISDDVAILSIIGTAVRLRNLRPKEWELVCSERYNTLVKRAEKCEELLNTLEKNGVVSTGSWIPLLEPSPAFGRWYSKQQPCSCLHLPFHHRHAVFHNVRVVRCKMCNRGWVPETLLSTTQPPGWLPTTGNEQYIEAHAVRCKEKSSGEQDCVAVSKELLFIEYEAHQQFIMKLKIHGFNSAFGVKSRIALSKCHIIMTITGTGMQLDALPSPPVVDIKRPRSSLTTERGLWHAYLWEQGHQSGRIGDNEVTLDRCVKDLSLWHNTTMKLAERRKAELLFELVRHDSVVSQYVAELVNKSFEKYGVGELSPYASKADKSKHFVGNVENLSLASCTTITSLDESTLEGGSGSSSSSTSSEESDSATSSDSSESGTEAGSSDENESVLSVSDDDLEQKRKGRKRQYVFNVDDEHDENVLASVLDRRLPAGMTTSTLSDGSHVRSFLLGGNQLPQLQVMKKLAAHKLKTYDKIDKTSTSDESQEQETSVTGPLYRLLRKLSPQHRLLCVKAALENSAAISCKITGRNEDISDENGTSSQNGEESETFQVQTVAKKPRKCLRQLVVLVRFNWRQTVMEIATKASLQTGKRYDASASFISPKANDEGEKETAGSTGFWSQFTSQMRKVRFSRKQRRRSVDGDDLIPDADIADTGSVSSDTSHSDFRVTETDALNLMYQTALSKLCYQAKNHSPCHLSGIRSEIDLPDSHNVEIKLMASVIPASDTWMSFESLSVRNMPSFESPDEPNGVASWFFVGSQNVLNVLNSTDQATEAKRPPCLLPHTLERFYEEQTLQSNTSVYEEAIRTIQNSSACSSLDGAPFGPNEEGLSIPLTSLSSVPGTKTETELGRINMHFVRESIDVKPSEDGLSRFDYALIQEVHASVRAYISALGGDALVHYDLTCQSNPGTVARNSAYRVVSISGDVVKLLPQSNECSNSIPQHSGFTSAESSVGLFDELQ